MNKKQDYTLFLKNKKNSFRILQINSISSVNNINGWIYNKLNVKLSDLQLNNLKSAVKNRQGITLRMNFKIFDETNFTSELLTTRQTTKLRLTFQNF